jgi:hypothetical protein
MFFMTWSSWLVCFAALCAALFNPWYLDFISGLAYRLVWAEAKSDATSVILDLRDNFRIFLQQNPQTSLQTHVHPRRY